MQAPLRADTAAAARPRSPNLAVRSAAAERFEGSSKWVVGSVAEKLCV